MPENLVVTQLQGKQLCMNLFQESLVEQFEYATQY